MVNINKYREYNPNTETIIESKSGSLIVIDRYGVNDYGAWWTDEEHLYDETYGYSTRGDFESVWSELNENS